MKRRKNTETLKVLEIKTFKLLLVGLIVRLLIIPFTVNWDLLANTQVALAFGTESLAEFYKQSLAAYPPLLYILLNVLLLPARLIGGSSFTQWISSTDLPIIVNAHVFRYLTLLKFPYILIELTSAYLFSKLWIPELRLKALALWIFNPISLFTISMWLNIDLIPISLMILAAYLYQSQQKPIAAAFSLGIAGACKLFPLLGAPFFILCLPKLKQKILATLAILLTVIFVHFPLISIPAYWKHAVTGGYSQMVLYTTLEIGQERNLVLYIFIYTLIFYWLQRQQKTTFHIITILSIGFIPMFVLSKFNLQWMLWLLPLFISYHLLHPKPLLPHLVIYLSYFGLAFLSQASLNIGMLAPIEPSLWLLGWPIKNKLGGEQMTLVLNLLQTIFAATLTSAGYQLMKGNENNAKT